MDGLRNAVQQTDSRSCSVWVQLHSSVRRKGDESRGSVYVSSRGDAERWPLSRVTDYRSLMLPRRLPRLAEMNHPSAFFCKPSITSDFPATDTAAAALPTDTHSYTHTLEEDTAQNLTGGTSSADESTQTLRERRPLSHILHLSVYQPSSFLSLSLFLSSPSALAYHFTCHFCASLLFCHLLLSLAFSSVFHPSSSPRSSKSRSSSPPRCALYHSGISVSRVWPGISLPSTTEQANHCWHFKRLWIKWLTVCRGMWKHHLFDDFNIPVDIIICLWSGRQRG